MLSAGIDIGTRTLKVCLIEEGRLLGACSLTMERDLRKLLKTAYTRALEKGSRKAGRKLKRSHIKEIVATGYGGHLVGKSSRRLSESVCLARAAHVLDEASPTVLSVGGLFIRAVSLDAEGFFLEEQENERCAAGSGRFLEMITGALEVPFEKISSVAGASEEPVLSQNSCAVFAESEVISFVNAGHSSSDILAGVLHSIAGKTMTVLERLGSKGPILLTGGIAKIPLFREMLSELSGREVRLPAIDAEMVSAYGAALIGSGNFARPRKRRVTLAVPSFED